MPIQAFHLVEGVVTPYSLTHEQEAETYPWGDIGGTVSPQQVQAISIFLPNLPKDMQPYALC